ncbi:hypothetical protein BKA56DRAFT_302700 [Ilyonectria sp. MPI-CAGE-AT-0026]|nr:hypothetical protein BKA56DRAFT_302700 [Ilyonectria sp. MPI-CAGE-AT-0026]
MPGLAFKDASCQWADGPGARPSGDPVYHSQGYQLRYGRLGHAGRSPLSVESNREPAAVAEDKKRETRNMTDRQTLRTARDSKQIKPHQITGVVVEDERRSTHVPSDRCASDLVGWPLNFFKPRLSSRDVTLSNQLFSSSPFVLVGIPSPRRAPHHLQLSVIKPRRPLIKQPCPSSRVSGFTPPSRAAAQRAHILLPRFAGAHV